jgi:hypothetical protein
MRGAGMLTGMENDNFWPCLSEMVGMLAGPREESEWTLDQLERELRNMPKLSREQLHSDVTILVGRLARLATRMKEIDPPQNSTW